MPSMQITEFDPRIRFRALENLAERAASGAPAAQDHARERHIGFLFQLPSAARETLRVFE